MNEVNKLIWDGSPFGLIDQAAWDKTVAGALSAVNQDGLPLITAEPADSRVLERVHPAGAGRARGGGRRRSTATYTPIDVVLTEGGQ